MNSKGFTIIELMIASAIMLLVLGGVITVYIVSNTFIQAGIAEVSIQKDAQVIGEKIIRWVRSGSNAEIFGSGDSIQIETKIAINPSQTVTSAISYIDGHDEIYYDSNISDGVPSSLILDGVYKLTGRNIFSKTGNIINVNFGIESDYLHGRIQPVEVSLRIRMRGAE